ncbi:MAG TPA: hypothetical protein VFU07_07530 [Candidatus Lumbricidophila sp.]|nr:hypothetical protein [Candidatus Lumbricidophila sp.]
MATPTESAPSPVTAAEHLSLPGWARDNIETLKRSYLYLRISLVGIVFAIFTAILLTPADFKPDGSGFLLPSISHYYYTPARIVFTGALCAAALALVAISGNGVQSHLLDFAALLAPLIAIVPTRTLPTQLGEAAGLQGCSDAWIERFGTTAACIPRDQLSLVAVGFGVWVCLAVVGLLGVIVQGAIRRTTDRWYWITFGFGVVTLLVYVILWWSPWSAIPQEGLQLYGHEIAAAVFFLVILIVAALEAIRQWFGDLTNQPEPAYLPRKAYAAIYAAVALAFTIDIGLAVWVLARRATIPDGNAVLWIEVVGLTAFALFWITQTVEHSHDSRGWETPSMPVKVRNIEHERSTISR